MAKLLPAQQLNFAPVSVCQPNYYENMSTFDYSRFHSERCQLVGLPRPNIYKQKKVRKIKVYSGERLAYAYELDTAGAPIVTLYPGYYYSTARGGYLRDKNTYVDTYNWYKGETLVRSDSIFRTQFIYKNNDTVIHFRRYLTKVHKSGALLNEQNTYYNENFYNKKSDIRPAQGWGPISLVDNKGKVIKTYTFDSIYLKKKLKTDYEKEKLYFCSLKKGDDEVYASKDNEKTEIDRKLLSRHRFVKKRTPNRVEKFYVDGEDFREPPDFRERMFCSHSQGNGQIQNSESRYEGFTQTLDKNGLYDSVFYFYYPPDTTGYTAKLAKRPQSVTRENFENPNYMNYPEPKRSKVPERRLEYVIRYEYFD